MLRIRPLFVAMSIRPRRLHGRAVENLKLPKHAAAAVTENPFFRASTLQYEAPPFDKIKDADFQPRDR